MIAPAVAHADTPVIKPAFAMMDNTGDGNELDLSLPASISTQSNASGVLIRPRILLQGYGGPSLANLGAYVSLNVAAGIDAGEDSTRGVGNLELGLLYHATLSPDLDLGIRVGLAAATASGGEAQSLDLGSTIIARPADLITGFPGNWLRLGISPTFHQGIGFARIDLGVDTAITDRDQTGGGAYFHVNVGAGFNIERLIATIEMQSLFAVSIGTSEDTLSNTQVFAGGVSARYQFDSASPYVMLSLPFSNNLTGDVLTLTVGLTAPI